jgi:hypothetical protein
MQLLIGHSEMPDGMTITVSGPVNQEDTTDLELALLLAREGGARHLKITMDLDVLVDRAGLAVITAACRNVSRNDDSRVAPLAEVAFPEQRVCQTERIPDSDGSKPPSAV